MNRSFLALWGAVFVCALSAASVQCADPDPSRGRLPDGRAFRVDDQGNQLVDYIAELEVNVEQLNRQVQSLQEELDEKRASLERAQHDKSSQTALLEKDLVNSKKEIAEKTRALDEALPCPELSCPDHADCPLQTELSEKIESLKSDLDVERQLSAQQKEEHGQSLAQLKRDLEDREIDLAQTKKELAEWRQEAADLRLVADDLKKRREEQEAQSAAPIASAPQLQPASAQSVEAADGQAAGARTSLSLARARAVDSLRGRMLTDLNQVQSLIVTRDELYRKYTQRRRTVAFTPSRPVSSSKRGVKEISAALKNATSVYEVSALGREIAELQSKISEDIGLMKRMDKVDG